MRIGFVIVLLAAIAVSLVHIRRADVRARYQVDRLERQLEDIGTQLGNQQLSISRLTSQPVVRRHAVGLALIEAAGTGAYFAARARARRGTAEPGR